MDTRWVYVGWDRLLSGPRSKTNETLAAFVGRMPEFFDDGLPLSISNFRLERVPTAGMSDG